MSSMVRLHITLLSADAVASGVRDISLFDPPFPGLVLVGVGPTALVVGRVALDFATGWYDVWVSEDIGPRNTDAVWADREPLWPGWKWATQRRET